MLNLNCYTKKYLFSRLKNLEKNFSDSLNPELRIKTITKIYEMNFGEKRIFSRHVYVLRKSFNFTYRQIGEILDCPHGTAHRLFQKYMDNPDYSETVKTKKNKKFKPIWDYLDNPISVYGYVKKIISNVPYPLSGIEKEHLKDYLLNFAYTLSLDGIEYPDAYLYKSLKRKIKDYLKRYEIKFVHTLDNNTMYGQKEICQ